jgi:hypothetical protein
MSLPVSARRAVVALATLVLALVVVEFVWRLRPTTAHGPTTNPRYVEHDAAWGWRYRPGARVRHTTEEFDVAVAINEFGFREQRAMPVSPEVVVLGDSYAFGWGVDGSETFAERLGELLERPVWNLSISGTGPGQQLLVLRERGRLLEATTHFAPRTLLVTFCGNDLAEASRDVSYRRRKPRFEYADGELRLQGVPVPEPLLERHSFLYRSVVGLRRERAQAPFVQDEVSGARELLLALYAEMARELPDSNVIVIHEGAEWLTAGFAGARNVQTLDVKPALDRAAAVEPVRFARDGHWNARGHDVVARYAAMFLRE